MDTSEPFIRVRAPCRAPLLLLALAAAAPLRAEEGGAFQWIEPAPMGETWLNAGFYSHHLERDRGLNDRNPGLGVEYRFSSVASATAGRFYNSDRAHSNYVGVYYQPIKLGPVRIGAVIGGFDGYPKMKIPVASVEYKRVGLNVSFVPSYKERLYGAVAFQFKVRLGD